MTAPYVLVNVLVVEDGVGYTGGAHCPACHGVGKIRVLVRDGAA